MEHKNKKTKKQWVSAKFKKRIDEIGKMEKTNRTEKNLHKKYRLQRNKKIKAKRWNKYQK